MGQALYLTGGRKKSRKLEEWHAYERAVILRVAPDVSEVTSPVEYVSPPGVCPDVDPSFIFSLVRRICGCRWFPGNTGRIAIALVIDTVSTDSRLLLT